MPRRIPQAVIDSIRTLAAEIPHLNQTEIGQRLVPPMQQSQVSKIMRANRIGRSSNKDAMHIVRGTTTYQTSDGEIALHLTVTRNGEVFRGYTNVSPEQLQQLTDYARQVAAVSHA